MLALPLPLALVQIADMERPHQVRCRPLYEGAAPRKSQASIKAPARPVVAFEDAAAIVLDGETDCDQDDRSAESPLQLEWRCTLHAATARP